MTNKYQPTWTLSAVYQLTPEMLKEKRIKGVLVDLDNTLVAWNNPDGTDELRVWIRRMKEAKIPVVVISNNSAPRIRRVVDKLELPYISRALKPFSHGLRRAGKLLQLPAASLVMVGDQLMTDIRAANRIGMRSILVKPLVESDAWDTRINRWRERRQLKKIYRDGKIQWKTELEE